MHHVLIALGSCHCPTAYIPWASQRLATLLADVRLSRVLWTQDIHGTDVFYMNRLAVGHTNLSADELQQTLKRIEAEAERSRGRVTVDMDLMQYDDDRYHLNDWPRPYIQQLLSDVL